MNKSKIWSGGCAVLIAATGAFSLTACSSGDGADGTETEVTQAATVDVADDLELARSTVLEALSDDPTLTQVMLASDVDLPTQQYGLLVMPYVASDASSRVTGTVSVDEGDFVIDAESAGTGETWQIDQDGNITQVVD